MTRVLPFLALLAALPFAASCARVPQEAVELSQVIGRDLETIHVANRNLAQRYFARMRQDVEDFVDQRYRPFIIRATMEKLNVIEDIKAATRPDAVLDPVDIMEIYADEAIRQVESFREEMMAPILAQEARLLQDIDQAFATLRDANAAVTGHLTSIRRVHEAQAEALEAFGVRSDVRDRISETAAGLSEKLNGLLDDAREAETDLNGLPGKVRDLLSEFSPVSN